VICSKEYKDLPLQQPFLFPGINMTRLSAAPVIALLVTVFIAFSAEKAPATSPSSAAQAADLVLYNACVYTVNPQGFQPSQDPTCNSLQLTNWGYFKCWHCLFPGFWPQFSQRII